MGEWLRPLSREGGSQKGLATLPDYNPEHGGTRSDGEFQAPWLPPTQVRVAGPEDGAARISE